MVEKPRQELLFIILKRELGGRYTKGGRRSEAKAKRPTTEFLSFIYYGMKPEEAK